MRASAWALAAGASCGQAAQAADPAPVAASAPVSVPARISTADFARQPLLTGPRISPDGRTIAAQVEIGGSAAVTFIPVTGGAPAGVSLGKSQDINWIRWAGNATLLVSVGRSVPWMDDKAYQTRLIAVDVATRTVRFIGGKTEGLIGDDVLWIDPEGRSVLLAFQRTIYDYPSVYSVDLATNAAREVVAARDDVLDWYADESGVVRAGFRFYGQRWAMLYRANESEKFRIVVKAREGDEDAGLDAFRIYQGSDDGYRVMLDEATGRFALYRFNFATRQRGELVFESPTNDVDDFDTDAKTGKLVLAWYRDRIRWFEPEMAELQANLDKAVGTRAAEVVSRSRDDTVLLVRLGASNDPGGFYVFSRADGTLHLFARVNEALKPAQLARSSYTSYKARDGLTIPAYLTLPPGRPAKGLPLVILPHGGPYDVRDDGDYDPEVQLLANRGYAVLQPQYRGSASYGKAFYEKGEGQWGRAMQDDPERLPANLVHRDCAMECAG